MNKTTTVSVSLLLLTLAVYSQVHSFPFLTFDDNQGLTGNIHVRDGLSWAGIAWAFTAGYASNWFPVTWLSHMLDFQIFGMDAGWHHLVNVLIHALSAVLLFALFKRMTGRLWESAFVAFVFALHPLHVESVAWISERKDVLFAFFWFLTTWLYLDFLDRRSTRNYLLMVGAFCLGLMSKQMIVTLPFALLLLDQWPLKRSGPRALLLEKVPLVALAIAASLIAFVAQNKNGALRTLDAVPLGARAANALMSYVLYIADFVWPSGLAAFYPLAPAWPKAEVLSAALALAAVSALVIWLRRWPYLAVGWFWYLGTLAPVIGLIQVGFQSRADRYTYVPLIGISIMAAWAAGAAFDAWPRAHGAITFAAIAVCASWTLVTWVQIPYWKDSITLYRRAIAVTDANYLAHLDLGVDLAAQGDYPQALRELYTSVEQNPDQPNARNSLGAVLYSLGRNQEAIEEFQKAVKLQPDNALAHCNLGNALVAAGNIASAVPELNTALRLDPGIANTYYGLGRVLVIQKRPQDAAAYFLQALRINPNFTEAKTQLEALQPHQ